MPVVPQNTITGPARVRLPNLPYARPRMAEAYGAVTSATANLAHAAGGAARVVDHAISAERDRLQSMNTMEQAKANEGGAMWNGIAKLADIAVRGTIEYDRIAEQRAMREADEALTDLKNHMSRAMYGSIDEATGKRTPGTLEAPYSPSSENGEPSGAVNATSKAWREWHESDESRFSKLSPRAREAFMKKSAGFYEDVMRSSFMQDAKSHVEYKNRVIQEGDDASFRRLAQIGASVRPEDQPMFDATLAREAEERTIAHMQTFLKNPDATNFEEAKWIDEDKAATAMAMRDQFMSKAVKMRLDSLTQLAATEEDAAARQAIIDRATQYAQEAKASDGKPFLLPDEQAKLEENLKAADDRVTGAQMKEVAQTGLQVELVQQDDPKKAAELSERLDLTMAALPPGMQKLARKQIDDRFGEITLGNVQDAIYTYADSGNPQDYQAVREMIDGIQNKATRGRAKEMLAKFEGDTSGAASKRVSEYAEAIVDLMILRGGTEDANGRFIRMSDWDMAEYNRQAYAEGRISKDKYISNVKTIRERRPEDEAVMQEAVEALDAMTPTSWKRRNVDISGMFTVSKGVVDVARNTSGDNKNKPVASLDDSIGYVPFQYKDEDGDVEQSEYEMEVEFARDVLQAVVKYYKTDGGTGPRMTPTQLVRELTSPEKGVASGKKLDLKRRKNRVMEMQDSWETMAQRFYEQEAEAAMQNLQSK